MYSSSSDYPIFIQVFSNISVYNIVFGLINLNCPGKTVFLINSKSGQVKLYLKRMEREGIARVRISEKNSFLIISQEFQRNICCQRKHFREMLFSNHPSKNYDKYLLSIIIQEIFSAQLKNHREMKIFNYLSNSKSWVLIFDQFKQFE